MKHCKFWEFEYVQNLRYINTCHRSFQSFNSETTRKKKKNGKQLNCYNNSRNNFMYYLLSNNHITSKLNNFLYYLLSNNDITSKLIFKISVINHITHWLKLKLDIQREVYLKHFPSSRIRMIHSREILN